MSIFGQVCDTNDIDAFVQRKDQKQFVHSLSEKKCEMCKLEHVAEPLCTDGP